MAVRKNEDLRFRKTKQALHDVFQQMICEMDYEEITVKELTERAMVNRKTFYLHYGGLDDLLTEMQDEIASRFIRQKVSYKSLNDIKQITRYFFEYTASMPKAYERLLCSGSYSRFGEMINKKIMDHRAQSNRGAFSHNNLVDNLVFAYFAQNSTILYRQWVTDGKKLPLEELIETATKLICYGISSYVR